jgi:hypothetical protein
MMEHLLQQRPAKVLLQPLLYAGGRLRGPAGFGNFSPESGHLLRKAQVAESQALKGIMAAWKALPVEIPTNINELSLFSYEAAVNLVGNLSYSSRHVTEFSLLLPGLAHERGFGNKAGVFLSALINGCSDGGCEIHVPDFPEIDCLGAYNNKNLTVHGNAGNYFGEHMTGGELVLTGNAGSFCGSAMAGGSMLIRGDAGAFCGSGLRGGCIRVLGGISLFAPEDIIMGRVYHGERLLVHK